MSHNAEPMLPDGIRGLIRNFVWREKMFTALFKSGGKIQLIDDWWPQEELEQCARETRNTDETHLVPLNFLSFFRSFS